MQRVNSTQTLLGICLSSFLLTVFLTGCAGLKLQHSGGVDESGGNGGGGKQSASGGKHAEESEQGVLSGDWRLGYKWKDQTFNASMTLKQHGNTFTGSGKEDESGFDFLIQHGQIAGDQISFTKKYTGKNASIGEIQYTGALTTANEENYKGPYLSGDYSMATKDGQVSNDWDAVRDTSPAPAATEEQAPAPPTEQAPVQQNQNLSHPDKPPDLSGKWDVGFEYQFKTIHSVMFLEQDHDKIVGHGIDDTKEKFVIEKGWYHFPKLTLIRKYPKSASVKVKGKTHEGKPAREMTFKADVSMANDKDYQGPYLGGKTDGGGNWEAELIK